MRLRIKNREEITNECSQCHLVEKLPPPLSGHNFRIKQIRFGVCFCDRHYYSECGAWLPAGTVRTSGPAVMAKKGWDLMISSNSKLVRIVCYRANFC